MTIFARTAHVGGKSATGHAVASPEDAFLAWVLWLPAGADLAACARVEIARIDEAAPCDERSLKLRSLFVEAAASAGLPC